MQFWVFFFSTEEDHLKEGFGFFDTHLFLLNFEFFFWFLAFSQL